MSISARNQRRDYLKGPLFVAEHGLKNIQDTIGRETRVPEQLAQHGYHLMNRGRQANIGLCTQPATLDVLEGFREHMDQRLRRGSD